MKTLIKIIIFSIIGLLLPLILKPENSNIEGTNKIVFAFNSKIKIIGLLGFLVFAIPTIMIIITSLNEITIALIIGTLTMLIFTMGMLYCYLLLKNKKIIYDNNTFYSYNFIGKEKIFYVQDIAEAMEYQSDCMKLILKDNTKIKIDTIMNNYPKIKEILDTNGIIYKDKYGNTSPKGW